MRSQQTPLKNQRKRLERIQLATLVSLVFLALCSNSFFTTGHLLADAGDDEFNLGAGLYQKSRWDLAGKAFERFLVNHPNHAKAAYARLYLGIALQNQEQYNAARKAFRDFVRLHQTNKNLPDAVYRVAECSYFLGELKVAEQEFDAYLTKYPDHEFGEWALPYLGDVQLQLGKPKEALVHFQQSLRRFPKGRMIEDAKFGSARAYESLKDPAAALTLYRELAATKGSARAPVALFQSAVILFETGKRVESVQAFERLIADFPDHRLVPSAHMNIGFAHYRLADRVKARAAFAEAMKAPEQAPAAIYWQGVCYREERNPVAGAALLKPAAAKYLKSPYGERLLHLAAVCEFQRGEYASARKLFLDVVTNFPRGPLADDSLLQAAEAEFSLDRPVEAAALVKRFGKEYPKSGLSRRAAVLEARVQAGQGGTDNMRKAASALEKLLADSPDTKATVNGTQPLSDETTFQARFHLGRIRQQLGEFQGVIDAVAPVVADVRARKAESAYGGALVLAAVAWTELKKYDEAASAYSDYLTIFPQGAQANDVLAKRAVVEFRRQKRDRAKADFEAFAARKENRVLAAATAKQLADLAYQSREWKTSAEFYTRAIELEDGPTANQAAAISGLAWCQFQQEEFAESAKSFGRVMEHPGATRDLAAEAGYKQGESLTRANQLAAAAAAFGKAFQKLAPAKPAEARAEEKPGAAQAIALCGLQQARLLKELNQVKEADAAYASLTEKFPKAAAMDKWLDEWAVLHYAAGDYKRSDELFARLAREYPQSPLALNARYSLAESDYTAGRLDPARKSFRELYENKQSPAEVREFSLYRLIGLAVELEDWTDALARCLDYRSNFARGKFVKQTEFYEAESRFRLSLRESESQKRNMLREAAEKILTGLREENLNPPKPAAGQTSPAAEPDWLPRVWILLAEIRYASKKYDEARNYIAEMNKRFPQTPLLYQGSEIVGRCHKNQARFDEARKAFEQVVKDPHGRKTATAAKCQLLIAETYLLQKKFQQAQLAYFEVYTSYKFPEFQAPALFQVGICDEQLGNWDRAVKTYEDLIREFPKSDYATRATQRLPAARAQQKTKASTKAGT